MVNSGTVARDLYLLEFLRNMHPMGRYFSEIRRETGMHPMTLSRSLKRLMKAGLLERDPSGVGFSVV